MKKVIAALTMTMLMVGCGDDSIDNVKNDNSILTVNDVSKLGNCSSDNENKLIYVVSENSGYICVNREWTRADKTSNSICSSCEYGVLTDDRDGQSYRTTKIGEQWWMAENLNYAYTQRTAELDSSSVCIENNPDYCNKFGRFYLWSAAMDSAGLFSKNGLGCGFGKDCEAVGNVRGVCPSGWHLPSKADYEKMFTAVGGVLKEDYRETTVEWQYVGSKLFAMSNQYGFDAIPVGYVMLCSCELVREGAEECRENFFSTRFNTRSYASDFKHIDNYNDCKDNDCKRHYADFWTSSIVKSSGYAFAVKLSYYSSSARLCTGLTVDGDVDEKFNKYNLVPVRCVKD